MRNQDKGKLRTRPGAAPSAGCTRTRRGASQGMLADLVNSGGCPALGEWPERIDEPLHAGVAVDADPLKYP